MEFDIEDITYCPECGGDGVPLGTMGRLQWFRCRSCGIDYHTWNDIADDDFTAEDYGDEEDFDDDEE